MGFLIGQGVMEDSGSVYFDISSYTNSALSVLFAGGSLTGWIVWLNSSPLESFPFVQWNAIKTISPVDGSNSILRTQDQLGFFNFDCKSPVLRFHNQGGGASGVGIYLFASARA